MYGRGDEASSSLPGQKVFCIELFDKVYFKEPFPGLRPRNYFKWKLIKMIQLQTVCVINYNTIGGYCR